MSGQRRETEGKTNDLFQIRPKALVKMMKVQPFAEIPAVNPVSGRICCAVSHGASAAFHLTKTKPQLSCVPHCSTCLSTLSNRSQSSIQNCSEKSC